MMGDENKLFRDLSCLTSVDIDEVLGSGAYCSAYSGTDLETGERVVAKVELTSTKYHKLSTEIELIRNLEHPGLAKYFRQGVGKLDNKRKKFVVQEFAGELSLEDQIERKGKLEIDQSIDYTIQILNIFDLFHRNNKIGVDLRPVNIMVKKNKLKFVDLGLVQESPFDSDEALGEPSFLCGDWEQDAEVTFATDIYVAGMILYHMLTGQIAFEKRVENLLPRTIFRDSYGKSIFLDNGSKQASLYIHCHEREPRPDIVKERPEMSYKLASIWRQMMEPDRELRYSSAKEVLKALDKL